MADISAKMVKELRDRTLAGFSDCKKALVECEGDLDKAADFLRKKGLVTAQKKAGRTASAGLVHSYIHAGGRIGVLLEVNCETDFVAKTEQFGEFVKDVAMQVAAMSPRYLTSEDVPEADIAKEREIRVEQARQSGKPDNVLEKIVDGQIKKWYSEVCLMEQPFVKEPKQTVGQYAKENGMEISQFIHWVLGE